MHSLGRRLRLRFTAARSPQVRHSSPHSHTLQALRLSFKAQAVLVDLFPTFDLGGCFVDLASRRGEGQLLPALVMT